MSDKTSKRFLSIRITDVELKQVYQHMERSTCNSLTEYAKKVLLARPLIIKVRDESKDLLLQELIGIKNKLNLLTEQALQYGRVDLLSEITQIKLSIRQICEK